MTAEEYLRVADVAERLNVTPQAVYKWIKQGHLRGVRFGTERGIRIPRSALEEFERRAAREYNPNDIRTPMIVAA